jgi:hypothetical protein
MREPFRRESTVNSALRPSALSFVQSPDVAAGAYLRIEADAIIFNITEGLPFKIEVDVACFACMSSTLCSAA